MTTIAIDCRFAGTGTGLSRYAAELTSALLSRADADIRYVFIVRRGSDIGGVPSPHRIVVADIPHYSFAEQTKLPAILRSAGADLAFFTHFNAPFFCPLPFVATVHDLILHRYPGNASFVKRAAYKILVFRALRRARAIIAVSAWTKSDIVRTYGAAIGAKVSVIGEGVGASYVPQEQALIDDVMKKYGVRRPYFLFVGNAKPHKNVPFLIEAFRAAATDADLVLVSGGSEARALLLPDRVHLLEGVPDDDLPALYSGARSFVTASLDEGYCLPIAEALACGCPVIGTKRSAIPEIMRGCGLLVEPTLEAFIEAFRHPPTLPEAIRLERWEDAAEKVVALFRTITRS